MKLQNLKDFIPLLNFLLYEIISAKLVFPTYMKYEIPWPNFSDFTLVGYVIFNTFNNGTLKY